MLSHMIVLVARLLSGARPRWLAPLPDPPRPQIFFANHTSHLDAVVLWSALPPEARRVTRPVAARDYWDAGPIRRYISKHVFRAVLIERKSVSKSNNPLDAVLKALDAGESLIIFPEGTRNAEGCVDSFKSGLYHIARARPDIGLVPVYLENLNRVMPKGEVLPVPILCSVTFGSPIRLGEGEPKTIFLQRARDALLALHCT